MTKMGEGAGSIKFVSSGAGYYEEVSEDPCVDGSLMTWTESWFVSNQHNMLGC